MKGLQPILDRQATALYTFRSSARTSQGVLGHDHPVHVTAVAPCHCSRADLSAGRLFCAAAGCRPLAQEVRSSCCARSGRWAFACCPFLRHPCEQQVAPDLPHPYQKGAQQQLVQLLLVCLSLPRHCWLLRAHVNCQLMLNQQVRCRWQQGLQQSQPGLQGLSWRLMQSFLLKQRASGPPCYPVLPQATAIRLCAFESMSGKGMHKVIPVNAIDLCCNRGMG